MDTILFRQADMVLGKFEWFHYWWWIDRDFIWPLTGRHKTDSQQFIWKIDKNWEKIFVWDMVSLEWAEYEWEKFIVVYSEQFLWYVLKNIVSNKLFHITYIEFTVIWNIYTSKFKKNHMDLIRDFRESQKCHSDKMLIWELIVMLNNS